MRYADLHLHTDFSDGTLSPEGLVVEAKKSGVSCISIVDHDTVLGIAPALQAGERESIEIIPGIEMSAEYKGREVHILGYLIDFNNKNLKEKLALLKKNRVERVHAIVKKLHALGIPLDAESVLALAQSGVVGRLHIARALVKEGFVQSTLEAFERFIADKGPAYVLGFKFSAEQAISLIAASGGIPVLAHPHTLHDDALIVELVKIGMRGLEVYYPEHTARMVETYVRVAKKHDLLVTGGSDFHGEAKEHVRIGMTKIPYELVEQLKAAKKESHGKH
ncbi:MAG: PHP domain-containing protein [Candidatus Omnitrophica bacterium]|nr:PHP domain-containing protein [Candidatus Omnitrophota bacterium]